MSIESVMPSSHLILCHPLFFIPSIFSSESALCIRWPKYWSFNISPCFNLDSFFFFLVLFLGFPGGLNGKESACDAGDLGSIPESGRSFGEGNGNPFQYSCLENSMDRGAWKATVHEVENGRTLPSDFHFHFYFHFTSFFFFDIPGKERWIETMD